MQSVKIFERFVIVEGKEYLQGNKRTFLSSIKNKSKEEKEAFF